MPTPLLLATRNQGKAREFQEMLGSEWEISTSRDFAGLPEVVEDGETFEANAEKKALAFGEIFPGYILADDSGLEVDALNGAPGIYSARFAGEPANDQNNNSLLLSRMMGICGKNRGAQFVCALVLSRGTQTLGVFKGVLRGKISIQQQGSGGFGYDPLFIPDGYDHSLGELDAEVKNTISHRAKALLQLVDFLKKTGLP